jgi:hypothetical protein
MWGGSPATKPRLYNNKPTIDYIKHFMKKLVFLSSIIAVTIYISGGQNLWWAVDPKVWTA